VRRLAVHALFIVTLLAVVAWLAPVPRNTDSEWYQILGREIVIPNCGGIHCTRVLVAAVLEHLPGPSDVKWKAYAVIANAIAGLAVARLCLLLEVSAPAAMAAAWISAFGFGSLYTLYDCYTSDPLMYMLGPLVAIAVWQKRIARAGVLSTIGVFAKEFAAAPLWIFTFAAALGRRWDTARRVFRAAAVVTLVWLTMQFAVRTLLNYTYHESTSADLRHGAYLAVWLQGVHTAGAVKYLFTTFSALWLLLPVGMAFSRRNRDLVLASIPAAAAFVYVQQPERALWNFHFIVIPIAMQVLQQLPRAAIVAFAVAFAVLNMRIGAQLEFQMAGRAGLAVSLAIAAAAVWTALRSSRNPSRSGNPAPVRVDS